MNILFQEKKYYGPRFEPMILCILTSCLDHYTTSVIVKMIIVALYVYCFTWRLVTYIRRRASRVPRRRPRHGVADQCINCASGGRSESAQAWRYSQVDSPSRKNESFVVPSQIAGQRLGLVHAQAIKSDLRPLQSIIKLFVWACISLAIKTCGTKNKLKGWIVQGKVQGSTSHHWKCMSFYAVQCFRL